MLFKCGLCNKVFHRKCQLYNHLNRKTSCKITEIVACSVEELTTQLQKPTSIFTKICINPSLNQNNK